MVRMYRLLLSISVSSFLNLFVYYIRRLPLIGRRIPERFYAAQDFKRGASVAVMAFAIIWAVIKQFIYIGLFIHLPAHAAASAAAGAVGSIDGWPIFLTLLFALSFVGGPLWNARAMETKRSKYIAVKLIRISPEAYMKGTLGYRYIVFLLSFVVTLSVFAAISGANPLHGALLGAALTGWRLVAEYVHLLLFRHKGWVPSKNNLYIWVTLIGCTAIAYGPLLLDAVPGYGAYVLSLPAALVYIAIGIFAGMRLLSYPNYAEAVDNAVRRDDPLLNLGQMMADARKADVEVKVGDYAQEALHSSDGAAATVRPATVRLSGYARLNALFFQRHRRIVRKPLMIRLAILGTAAAIASALLLAIGSPENWTLHTLLPFLPFVFYSFALGERLCRALFYNCDMPLMRYSFYREAAAKHFGSRLLRLASLNLLLGLACGAALTIVAAAASWPLTAEQLLPLWLAIIGLSILMSVHHLLLYYLLQPYTTEMNAKNPLFYLLNVVMSAACWITLVLKPQPQMIAAGVLVLAALYLLAGLMLVHKLGPKTFRLK